MLKGNLITTYLEKIQCKDESMFAIDSPHTGKKANFLKDDEEEDEDEDNLHKMSEEVHLPDAAHKRIMIDFDGVIHSYHKGWQRGKLYGYVIEGAKEAIDNLKNEFEIVIFTARVNDEAGKGDEFHFDRKQMVEDIKNWLRKNEIHFDRITGTKLPALAYVDDRAIRFENNWKQVVSKIDTVK